MKKHIEYDKINDNHVIYGGVIMKFSSSESELDKESLFDESSESNTTSVSQEEPSENAVSDAIKVDTIPSTHDDAASYDNTSTSVQDNIISSADETAASDSDGASDADTQKKCPVNHVGNGTLAVAIALLYIALFAVIIFLFFDKLYTNHSANSQATTIHILSQSEDVNVKAGTPTEFFIDAEGTNLTYQWYYRKSGDQMWHVWKNHTKSTTKSTANSSWDGMEVYCTITDNNRTTVASDIITITIEK